MKCVYRAVIWVCIESATTTAEESAAFALLWAHEKDCRLCNPADESIEFDNHPDFPPA